MNKRIYKFRSWLPEFNKMAYGHIGWINRKAVIGDAIYEKDLVMQNLMQFTGLLDRNGKEIYEGDIVKTITGLRQKIIYREDMGIFAMCRLDNIGATMEITFDKEGVEVIGNMYSNPELLTS